jgi:hypothetical protein
MSDVDNSVPKFHYVYMYIDPRNNEPIYVGKGSGDRYRQHLYGSHNRFLKGKIKSIRNCGKEPIVEIIFRSDNEDLCYDIEEHLIKSYGIKDQGGTLCNFSVGGRGNNKYEFEDETLSMLGKVNDQIVANKVGCCRETVGYVRRGLGIPKCEEKPNYSPPPDMGGWNKVEVPEECVSLAGVKPLSQLSREFGISVDVLRGHPAFIKKVSKGSDKTIYTFENVNTGEVFKGSRYEFAFMVKVRSGNVSKILNGKANTCKGWRLISDE